MRGAPITIRCECGRVEHVPYGERWQCDGCGRRWNTNQIPAEEYWGIMREMRRFRLVAIAAAVVIALVFSVLAIAVSRSVLILLPLVLGGWFIWYMPWWRRKVRQRARTLRSWELRPE
jgi:Flp pilus assembly protein TadB